MASEQSKLDNEEELSVTEAQSDIETADSEIESAQSDTEELSAEEQLEQAQNTIKEYWDQIMRLRAEIENNRKRAERDVENAHKYALRNFVEGLLPVIDSMEMGQTAADAENATLENIREGSAMTMNMFVQVLQKHGLEQLDPVGQKFDPELHQAISMIDAEGAESNSVIEVMQKGFTLNERLIRPAMVVVAK